MQIDLGHNDVERLREILQQQVKELDTEINATDSHRYRDALKESGRQLERILGAITSALAPNTPGPAEWEPRDDVIDSADGGRS